MYLRYILYAIVALIAFAFTYITCPIWAFIAALLKLDRLPGPLAWVHTHDDNIYGAKMRLHDFNEADTIPATFKKRFTNACWWIWRNPNYGFNANVLGLAVKGTAITQDILEGSENNYTRWTRFNHTSKNGGSTKYFGFVMIKPYLGKFHIKMWFGWQWHALDGSDRYMLKFAFNPFRTFKP